MVLGVTDEAGMTGATLRVGWELQEDFKHKGLVISNHMCACSVLGR